MKSSILKMLLSSILSSVLLVLVAYGGDYLAQRYHFNQGWVILVWIIVTVMVFDWNFRLSQHLARKDFLALWEKAITEKFGGDLDEDQDQDTAQPPA